MHQTVLNAGNVRPLSGENRRMAAVPNLTFKLVVDEDVCRRCRRCVAGDLCRGNAFVRFDVEESPFIDMSRCWGCLACTLNCPFGAVVRVE